MIVFSSIQDICPPFIAEDKINQPDLVCIVVRKNSSVGALPARQAKDVHRYVLDARSVL